MGNAFAIHPATGMITAVGVLNFEALSSYTLAVTVKDDVVPPGIGSANVTIMVNNLNEAATVTNATFTVDEYSLNGDPDRDSDDQ